MLELDIAALNARLFDNLDTEAIQMLVENQPDTDIDDSQLWSRWLINPGAEAKRTLGAAPRYLQLGTATLQIFVPKGLMTAPGNDVRTQFHGLFRNWRSADRKLEVYRLESQSSNYVRSGTEFHLINAMIFWRSVRSEA